MDKKIFYLAGSLGATFGGYLPTLFGDISIFSVWSALGSLVGGLGAIYLAYKLMK